MPKHRIDDIDIALLTTLQAHGRTKRSQMAEQVGLSIPAVSERMRRLEEQGVIRGYHALLDPRRVGLGVTAFIFITSESSRYFPQIVERATAQPEILECHAVTGEGSHLLKARTNSTASLEKLLSEIQAWPGVSNTRTSIVLSSPKEETALPLEYVLSDQR